MILKFFLSVFFSLTVSFIHANVFYLSNLGNDLYDGLSTSTPWRTLNKLNSQMQFLQPGDQVLFRCGDIFEGSINVPSGVTGTSGQPIIFGKYGSGDLPIISGSTSLSTWILHAPRIWKTTLVADTVWQVFGNQKRLTCARTPNQGYFIVSSTSGQNNFTSGSIAKPVNYWKNTTVLLHLNEFWWKGLKVDSSSATGFINFSNQTGQNINPGSGFFIQNKIELLDTLDEWFFNKSQQTLYLYSNVDPSTRNISASTFRNGFSTTWPWLSTFISIQDLQFQEHGEDEIQIRGFKGLIVRRCKVYRAGQYGIIMTSDYNSQSRSNLIEDNLLSDNCSNAIYTFKISNSTITRNSIKNTGLYPSPGGAGEFSGLSGMRLWFGDSLSVSHNVIDSSGYAGINIEKNYHLVEKNICDHSMLLLSDGGAIYNGAGSHCIYRSNILRNTKGDMSASAPNMERYTREIYFDSYGHSFNTIDNNTIISDNDNAGIHFSPNASNNTVKNNVTYKCRAGLEIYNWDPFNQAVNTMNIKRNTFYANRLGSTPVFINTWNGFTSIYTSCDSNYLCNPFSDTVVKNVSGPNANYYDILQWRTISTVDLISTISYYQWTYPEDHSFIITNILDNFVNYTFNPPVYTLDNVPISTLTLSGFSSKVLIGTSILSQPVNSTVGSALVNMFPNPSPGMVTVQMNGTDIQLELVDVNGKILLKLRFSNETDVNLDFLPIGVYYFRLKNGNTFFIERIIKI